MELFFVSFKTYVFFFHCNLSLVLRHYNKRRNSERLSVATTKTFFLSHNENKIKLYLFAANRAAGRGVLASQPKSELVAA